MIVEIKQTIKPTLILGGLVALIGLFFDYRFSLSVCVGVVFSIIHLSRLERNITLGLENKKRISGWVFMFITDLILLAFPLALVVIFPQLFDFIGAAVGLLLNKIVLYAMNWKRKG